MPKFPEPISNLINEFNKLPGIGPKTSERQTRNIKGDKSWNDQNLFQQKTKYS